MPVTIVDSRALGMVMGYAVLSGARLAAGGASAGEVADLVRATCAASTVVFYVDTLEYLRRGGRIGKAGCAGWGRPCRSSRSSGCATGTSCRWSGCAPRPGRSRGSRTSRPRRRRRCPGGLPGSTSPCTTSTRRSGPSGSRERLTARLGSGSGVAVRVVELGAVVGAHVGPGHARGGRRAPGRARTGALNGGALTRWCSSWWSRWRSSPSSASSSGSINPAALVARALGATCAPLGSGNPGATNAGRVLRAQVGCAWCSCSTCSRPTCPRWSCCAAMGIVTGDGRRLRGGARARVLAVPARARGQGGGVRTGDRAGGRAVGGAGAVVVFCSSSSSCRSSARPRSSRWGWSRWSGCWRRSASWGLVPPVVGVWLVALAALVLWRHRRNILAWWKRRLR